MDYELSLYKDEAAPLAQILLPPGGAIHALYVIHGGLRVRSGRFSGVLGGNSAFHMTSRNISNTRYSSTPRSRCRDKHSGARRF